MNVKNTHTIQASLNPPLLAALPALLGTRGAGLRHGSHQSRGCLAQRLVCFRSVCFHSVLQFEGGVVAAVTH